VKPAQRFDDFPAYSPIVPFEVLSARLGIPVDQIIKLDANENPYGPSPRTCQALAELAFSHIYPDPESRSLRAALSSFTGVPEEYLLAGAGADELIDLILRVLIEPGDCVLSFPPTFGMYAFDARLNGARVVEVPRWADFSLDLPAVLRKVEDCQPKVIFLTSPNNPDGRLISQVEIDTLLSLPILVVLDEAYIEFSDQELGNTNTRIGLVPLRENLVVLRTFSKWAGLAGLRVGYGAFPAWLLPLLWKAKQPYNVNVAGSAAAIASLEDLDVLAGNVHKLILERRQLLTTLATIPFLDPYPSQANFILCKVLERSARVLRDELMANGILVRYYDTALLQDYIRITVGRPEDTEAVIKGLKQYG
jgi:histidinol-phosphate aminotransferase